jgi:UTP--glucose-1-phosphate uridylyltransferase
LIKKAVIPAAGLGTRLLPATKEQPKEMLPILTSSSRGRFCLKPFLQLVFENLYNEGFSEICFIVGRGKRSIEDHFTVDDNFVSFLKSKNKIESLNELVEFYSKVKSSTIAFANQPEPLGFADSVYRAKFFTGNENFVVHAGDDLILSKSNYLQRIVSVFEEQRADSVFFVQRVEDPRKYGVVTGHKILDRIYHVDHIVEKPSRSQSKLAIIATYVFSPKLFGVIEKIKPGVNNEMQLSDAIQMLINENNAVYAVELGPQERRIEIGDPASYREAFTAKII